MTTKAAEARFETGASPGKAGTDSSSFSAKQIYFPCTEFSWEPTPDPLYRDDEMRATHEPLSHLPEHFTPSWSMTTRAYPDTLAFLLKWLLGAPVTTAGNGVITDLAAVAIPAPAYRHQWTAPYSSSGSPITVHARAILPDESMFYKLAGATLNSIEIGTPDSGGVTVSCSGNANYVTTISDPTLTAAYESLTIPPFLKAHATLTWLTGSAATETLSWSLTNEKVHTATHGGGTAGQTATYPDLIEFADGVPVVGFSIDKRSIDVDDWNALIAATRFTILSGWVNTAIIGSGYPYKFHIQGPSTAGAYAEGGGVSVMNRRRTPMSFSGRLSRETAASSVIEVVNITTSYA